MNQLVVFPYGADVTVHHGTVKVDAVVIMLLHELQAPLLEVTGPLVPNLGVKDCFYCQVRCSVAIRAQVKHKQEQIVMFDPKWLGDTKFFQPGVFAVENGNYTLPRHCLQRKKVAPNRGYNQDLDPDEMAVVIVVGPSSNAPSAVRILRGVTRHV